MKYKSLFITLAGLLTISLLSYNQYQVVTAAHSDWFDSTDAPTDYFKDDKPKRIVANVGPDASKGMRVTWQINKNIDDQYIMYTPYSDVTYSQAKKVNATITPWEMVHEEYEFATYLERNICRVDLDDLTPGVKYRYRVGNDNYLSEEYTFETSKGEGDFTFAVISDPQSVRSVGYQPTSKVMNRIIQEDKADFLMIGGDISELGGVESLYNNFFETQNILKKMPIATIPGNHETLLYEVVETGSYYHEHLGEYRAYSAHFYNPSNGPEFSLNSSYYYKYNDCLFIMINTQFDTNGLKDLASWVDQTIEENPSKYVIAMMHKGCYGNRYYGQMDFINNVFAPVFDKNKVDLVLSGHDHTWARTYPISNFKAAENENDGVIYCIVGSPGPKLYEPAKGAEKQFAYSNTTILKEGIYSYITVNEDGIYMNSNFVSGGKLDEFFIPAKRDSSGKPLDSNKVNLQVDVETFGTSAEVDLTANTLNNVKHLVLEDVDGTEIRKIERQQIDFTIENLKLNSKYDYQIRIVYTNGTSEVVKFSFQTESYLKIENGEVELQKTMDGVSKYNVYLNGSYMQTLYFDEKYSLPSLSSGKYLVRFDQILNDKVVCQDYIFINV